jgi:hypothetical protein
MQSLVRVVTLCSLALIAPLAGAQNPKNADESGGRGAHWREKLTALSPSERAELRTAHLTAMKDPAGRAARLKMRQARKEFRDSMRASMLEADPAIQPILNKIPEGRGHRDS